MDTFGQFLVASSIFCIVIMCLSIYTNDRVETFYKHCDIGETINFQGESCVLREVDKDKRTISIQLPDGHNIPISIFNLDDEEFDRVISGNTVFPKEETEETNKEEE